MRSCDAWRAAPLTLVRVALVLVTARTATAALNNLGLDVEQAVKQPLRLARELVWVDRAHLEEGDDYEKQLSCDSSQGPCSLFLETTAPDEVNGLLPLAFLGDRGIVSARSRQRAFLDSVAAADTFSDNHSLHDSLRTLSQLERPASYRHVRKNPAPPGNTIQRGALRMRALWPYAVGSRVAANHSLGLPNGTSAEWHGTWEYAPGAAFRLTSVAGHLSFSRRLLVTRLELRSCGEAPPPWVLLAGRQGLNVVWTRLVPLDKCSSVSEGFDIMAFNATLLSVDEIFIAVAAGYDVCLAGLEVSAFAELIRVPNEAGSFIVETADTVAEDGVTDVDHLVLSLHPGHLELDSDVWYFQPVRVSSSALGRLITVQQAMKGGLRLRTFSKQESQCFVRGELDESTAVLRAMALLRGDKPASAYSKPKPPFWSNETRAHGASLLDEALRAPTAELATVVPELCMRTSLLRSTLLSADWTTLGSNRSNEETEETLAAAKTQQRALDSLVALALQRSPPGPQRKWRATGHEEAKSRPDAAHPREIQAVKDTSRSSAIANSSMNEKTTYYGTTQSQNDSATETQDAEQADPTEHDMKPACGAWGAEACAAAIGALMYLLVCARPWRRRACPRPENIKLQGEHD